MRYGGRGCLCRPTLRHLFLLRDNGIEFIQGMGRGVERVGERERERERERRGEERRREEKRGEERRGGRPCAHGAGERMEG